MANGPKPSRLEDFEIINKLGEGSFGVAYKVRKKGTSMPMASDNGSVYVLKVIKMGRYPATNNS